jgi:hypothetical protein
MLVPILCLIVFVIFMEFKLKKELIQIEKRFIDLENKLK